MPKTAKQKADRCMVLAAECKISKAERDESQLLQPLDRLPPPLTIGGSADTRSPLIISAPHAGSCYAAELFSTDNLTKARAFEETGTEWIASSLSSPLRPSVIAQAARAVVDVNRPASALDTHLHDGIAPCTDTYRRYVEAGYGVIPRLDRYRRPLHKNRIPLALAHQIITTHHRPYHQLLETHIDTGMEHQPKLLLMDIHSMPDETHNRQYPDFVFGNLFGATLEHRLVKHIDQFMRSTKWSWRWNSPYAGGYTTRHYGLDDNPAYTRLSALQIECNRSLFETTKGTDNQVLNAMCQTLEEMCQMLEAEI